MTKDRHKTRLIARILAILVSALFAAIAVAGYQRTGDITQLLVLLLTSVIAYFVVMFIFKGVDKLLDSIDDQQ
jgi:ABC-type arginine transport system permease subunit